MTVLLTLSIYSVNPNPSVEFDRAVDNRPLQCGEANHFARGKISAQLLSLGVSILVCREFLHPMSDFSEATTFDLPMG